MILKIVKMPVFWLALIVIGFTVLGVMFLRPQFKAKWGRHEELVLISKNSGSKTICVNAIVLDEYKFAPGVLVPGAIKDAVISYNVVTEYVTIRWESDEGGEKFTQKVNLWEIVPKDVEGEYLNLVFDINTDANDVNVTYYVENID